MKRVPWTSESAEVDALAFEEPAGEPRANHVEKRRQKRKGVEVIFDPQAHK